MQTGYKIAGIDVHKKMLAVVVCDSQAEVLEFEGRRFGSTVSELRHLLAWLQERGVQTVVMESTAQYWKPVWMELEGKLVLHLAHAWSNRARMGRKTDFRDAIRLVKRLLSGDLILSYVPEAGQRMWRTLTRHRQQLIRDRVRLHSQLESLLQEMQIKLSSVISDLLGVSGRRMLRALSQGQTDPGQLAALADPRLEARPEQLQDALSGRWQPSHPKLLALFLDRLALLEAQLEELEQLIAEELKGQAEAVVRIAELPGLGVNSAHQILAEVGPQAAVFQSAGALASWVGVCPGRQESAGNSRSNHSPKGNPPMRRLLNQAAHAAVKEDGSYLQAVFRHWLPTLGYNKAIWAIAHKICRLIWKVLHDGIHYLERGQLTNPRSLKRKRQKLVAQLRKMGYQVQLTPLLQQAQG